MLSYAAFVCLSVGIYGSEISNNPQLDGKIVGGTPAQIEDYPWQVSLQVYGNHACGGSILDEITILTAAHCTNGFTAGALTIRAGSTYYDKGGQVIQVKQIREHKGYDQSSMNNDLSILKLQKPLRFNNAVKSIHLQQIPIAKGLRATVTGWGVVNSGNQNIPEHLLQVTLDIISQERCQKEYGSEAVINDNMICAQTAGKDSCQGDSGGPLVADGKLIGVVSWGFGCADPNFPGIYVNIANMNRWIDSRRY